MTLYLCTSATHRHLHLHVCIYTDDAPVLLSRTLPSAIALAKRDSTP